MRKSHIGISSVVALAILGMILLGKRSEALPVLMWNPQNLTSEIVAGESTSTVISFSSSQKLIDALVHVSRELDGIITVTPASLGTVPPGQTVYLTVKMNTAATVRPSSLQGFISLQRKSPFISINYGSPLQVDMKIKWPLFSAPDGAYNISYPPILSPSFDPEYQVLSLNTQKPNELETETTGILVSQVSNSEDLSVADFYDGDPGTDLVGQSLGAFSTGTLPNGITYYRFDPAVTLGGAAIVIVPLPGEFLEIQDKGASFQDNGIFLDILNTLSF
ncbi:MAG TPA: hypothetical protein VF173_07305 [Thermoanaerobaculia bacterium]|nr:hypothetical protein [Thermoanaerobaculia bacterium]